MSKVKTTPVDQEASLRKQIFDYSLSKADGPYQEFIAQLNALWETYNQTYFDSSMTPSAIFITPPQSPKALADCALFSAYGGKHQIRIRPTVIDGTYKGFNPNHQLQFRWLYIQDILLHEMIHQIQHEVLKLTESGYQSHGNEFTGVANRIGETLGLPPVFVRRRKDKSLPIAAQWPLNVRPDGYYGDLLAAHQDTDDEPETESEPAPEPDYMALAIEAFSMLTLDQHPEFIDRTGIQLPNPLVTVNDDKPVETKTVIKPRKTRKVKSPPGCLSAQEISTIICLNTDITVLKDEFQEWLKKGLFPASDTTDKNGNIFWSQALAQTWFDAIPDGCRDSRTTSIRASSTTTF